MKRKKRKEVVKVYDLGIIQTICNLIMCRLTNGLWVWMMLFTTVIGRKFLAVCINFVLIYVTRGVWLLAIAVWILMKPYFEIDRIRKERKQRQRGEKLTKRQMKKQAKLRRKRRNKRLSYRRA